jgi:hypothetical protein
MLVTPKSPVKSVPCRNDESTRSSGTLKCALSAELPHRLRWERSARDRTGGLDQWRYQLDAMNLRLYLVTWAAGSEW